MPPQSVAAEHLAEMRDIARRLALRLGVVGLMNVQLAVYEGKVYVIEVNPRASRTVPFIAKAAGVSLVKIASQVMAGKTLEELGFVEEPPVPMVAVKAPVFPFRRFPGVDPVLGPEMKSTGEVMGLAPTYGLAFAKAWIAAGNRLPLAGRAFVSVPDRDKQAVVPIARRLTELGFELLSTSGTAALLEREGMTARVVRKVREARPHVADLVINGEVDLVINTPKGREEQDDGALIRTTAMKYSVPLFTNLAGATAAVEAIAALQKEGFDVMPLQELHGVKRRSGP